MAVCPKCFEQGELAQECPKCHRFYVDADDLRKSKNDEMLGDIIDGKYILLSLIGEGGMGKIFRAKQKYTNQIVALKILKSEYMEDETLKDRFFREAEVVSALNHPNIVKMYGCAPDEKHNTLFMAMELLVGRTMFDVLHKEVPPLATLVRWFSEMASGLGEAHKHGVFHRDLKPENIFMLKDDDGVEHVKILDFGFARLQGASKKLTMAGIAFGTPHYMSPEQAMGLDDITAAVDVYALGVMMFQAVSGHLPFDSPNGSPMDVMYAQVHSETPPCTPRPEYRPPERLIKCIYKCMEKQPAKRFPDGHALNLELQEIANELKNERSIGTKPAPITNPTLPTSGSLGITGKIKELFTGENQLVAIMVSAIVVLIIIVIVLFATVL